MKIKKSQARELTPEQRAELRTLYRIYRAAISRPEVSALERKEMRAILDKLVKNYLRGRGGTPPKNVLPFKRQRKDR